MKLTEVSAASEMDSVSERRVFRVLIPSRSQNWRFSDVIRSLKLVARLEISLFPITATSSKLPVFVILPTVDCRS